MFTIKNKLIGMAIFGLFMAGLIGIYGYNSIKTITQSMHSVVTSASILRTHMFADMMHDALNSDVNAALLTAEKNNPTEMAEIEAELKTHSEEFTEALHKNEKTVTDKKTRAALTQAFPALEAYIKSATDIVQKAKTDRAAAMLMLDDFHKAFTSLEDVMESLTELIEEDARSTQATAAEAEGHAATMLATIIVIGTIAMAFISLSLTKNITTSLSKSTGIAERVASGDLTVSIDTSKEDEIGKLARSMEKMRANIAQVISQISLTTTKVFTSVEDISAVASATTSNMTQQRLETEQVATAMNQMTATVHEVSKNISSTAASANKATKETSVSEAIVGQAIQSIKSLADQIRSASETINKFESNSHNISSVLEVIKNIAEQTNLLALNAAIEAARAGEQGRGFAVVADEVRTLASRTQQSTGEINEMIGQLQAGSKSSVEAINKSCEQAIVAVSKAEDAGKSLLTIAATVNEISELSTQIATAAEEQSSVSEEINRNIIHISDAATHTVDGNYKTSEAVSSLAKMTAELQNLVHQFKVN